MKAEIFHESNPHPEPFFIHKEIKFKFLGTEKGEFGWWHTIRNTTNGKTSTVAHSVLEEIVNF